MAGFGVLVLLRAAGAADRPAAGTVTMGVVALLALAANWPVPPCSTPGGRVTPICARRVVVHPQRRAGQCGRGGRGAGRLWQRRRLARPVVATGMAVLALHSARSVIGHARAELRQHTAPANAG